MATGAVALQSVGLAGERERRRPTDWPKAGGAPRRKLASRPRRPPLRSPFEVMLRAGGRRQLEVCYEWRVDPSQCYLFAGSTEYSSLAAIHQVFPVILSIL